MYDSDLHLAVIITKLYSFFIGSISLRLQRRNESGRDSDLINRPGDVLQEESQVP